jgi:hypothetical protein
MATAFTREGGCLARHGPETDVYRSMLARGAGARLVHPFPELMRGPQSNDQPSIAALPVDFFDSIDPLLPRLVRRSNA